VPVGDVGHEREGEVPLLATRPAKVRTGFLPRLEELAQVLDGVLGGHEGGEHAHRWTVPAD